MIPLLLITQLLEVKEQKANYNILYSVSICSFPLWKRQIRLLDHLLFCRTHLRTSLACFLGLLQKRWKMQEKGFHKSSGISYNSRKEFLCLKWNQKALMLTLMSTNQHNDQRLTTSTDDSQFT